MWRGGSFFSDIDSSKLAGERVGQLEEFEYGLVVGEIKESFVLLVIIMILCSYEKITP